MEFCRRKKVNVHLNITSLIDIIFLLLIFLMLSSHFISRTGLKIRLPSAVSSKPYAVQKVIISISKDDKIFLNEKEVELDNLLNKLETEFLQIQKKTVVIEADEKINLGLAVKVMDIAKQAHVESLIILSSKEAIDAGE